MHDIQGVQILDAINYLLKVPASLRLLYSALCDNIVKQLPATRILHDQIQLLLRLYYFIQLHNIRMPDHLKNMYLPRYSLNISHIHNPIFLKYLHSNLFTREQVLAQFDLAEGTLAY